MPELTHSGKRFRKAIHVVKAVNNFLHDAPTANPPTAPHDDSLFVKVYLVTRPVESKFLNMVTHFIGLHPAHWGIKVGERFYELLPHPHGHVHVETSSSGYWEHEKLVGATTMSHEEIEGSAHDLAASINKHGGYNLFFNNCQHFVLHMLEQMLGRLYEHLHGHSVDSNHDSSHHTHHEEDHHHLSHHAHHEEDHYHVSNFLLTITFAEKATI